MKIRIQSKKDLYAGALFVFFGTAAILIARGYPIGTSLRMGPGYFPMILGALLNLIGLILVGRGLLIKDVTMTGWALRPLLFVFSAVLLFGMLIEVTGLAIAILMLVLVSRLGGSEFRIWEVGLLACALAAIALGIFVYGLALPFKVWPI
jgi:hypothetical protein